MNIRSNQHIKLRYVSVFVAEDYILLIEVDTKDINIERLVVGVQLFYKNEYLDMKGEPFKVVSFILPLEDNLHKVLNSLLFYF